jgi:hypothetical protein
MDWTGIDVHRHSPSRGTELAGWKLGLSFVLTSTFLFACFRVILMGHAVAGSILAVIYLVVMMIMNVYNKPNKETCHICGKLLEKAPSHP